MRYVLIAIDEAETESLLNGGIIAAYANQEEAISAGRKYIEKNEDERGFLVSVVDLEWPQSGTIALKNDYSLTEKHGVGPVGR